MKCGEGVPANTGAINPPNLSSNLKPRCRAIKDAKQARSIISTLETASRERNLKNSRIMAKYNSEKPYTTGELQAEGLGWKSNFTTKPLPMLIDKVAPRFVKTLNAAKYLTNSALPDGIPGNSVKTEAFRDAITKLIRAKPGWESLISEIAQENALFGFTAVAWLDEFHWFPKHFRQDQFFVPTGTKQLASSCQICPLKETFLVHELFDLIVDKEAATDAGWDVPNTVMAINRAMPENRRDKGQTWERVYEDLVREANVGFSHEAGALVVTVWHVLAQEITGKVSHYIFTESGELSKGGFQGEKKGGDGETLFEREDQFESMDMALAFFSFQQGNGKLHGSKGIGREIYSMAAQLDRARNEVVDRLNLAGKIVIQGDDKALKRFKMSVVGNALLIGQGYNVLDRKLDPAVEPFLSLDAFLTGLLDQIAGSTTPKVLEGERVTKAAVDLLAGREEESRDNIIGRFMNQFAGFVSTMQKRAVDKNTDDEDAKEMQKKLLLVMTRKEMEQLANQPVAETVKDFTEIQRQQVVLVAQEARGNPLYNQKEIERRKLVAILGDEFATAVLLPDEDPTVQAEQSRLQMFELDLITRQGTQIPVSPRDNHMVHLGVLMPALEQAAQAVAQQPDAVPILKAMSVHAAAHVQSAEVSGTPKDQLAPVQEVLNKLNTVMQQLEQLAQAEQATRQAQGVVESGQADDMLPPAESDIPQ